MKNAPRSYSLGRRVVLLSSLWAAIAIFILGWVLVGLYRSSVDDSFNDLQLAQLYSLIASVQTDESGLSGSPDLGDANFREPQSGWYWHVSLLDDRSTALASPSLAGEMISRRSIDEVPYDEDFSRRFTVSGPHGSDIRVLETEIELDAGRIGLFQVAGNETMFQATIRDYTRQIAGLLGAFGIGVVVINALVILFGLRPLERLREALASVRDGKSDKLAGRYPSEIQPLADELNVMIDNNRRILDRSRMQVGNLAHSLKTPIAVLTNAAGRETAVPGSMVTEQAKAMQDQVQHYLDRARLAAQRETVVFRTDAKATVSKLVEVMAKINPDKQLIFSAPENVPLFAGEKEDLEEIAGNLLENACKWAAYGIDVSLDVIEGAADEQPRIRISVSDDGPGIPSGKRAEALKRGARIDEAKPGTGLGLSIVVEAVKSYGGKMRLDESKLGGLAVVVELPALRN